MYRAKGRIRPTAYSRVVGTNSYSEAAFCYTALRHRDIFDEYVLCFVLKTLFHLVGMKTSRISFT